MIDYSALNSVQRKAVEDTEGAVLVFAGAGSGKTRVLTHRVAYLVEQKKVNPYNILAITFTNKATDEMKARLSDMVGEVGVWVSTFHSLCTQILFRHADRLGYSPSFSIYDESASKRQIQRVLREKHLEEDKKENIYRYHISTAKNLGLNSEQYFMSIRAKEKDAMVIAEVYERYEEVLKENNAMDFDDLLIKCLQLFVENTDVLGYYQDKFRYIMVDEFQDTNEVQFALVKLLSEKWGNIFVVGDDDQSIYGWRGAVVKNIIEFDKHFPNVKTYKLVQNYRSTQKILDCANNLIKNNCVRADKELFTDKKGGVQVEFMTCPSEYGEVDKVIDTIYNLKKYNNYTNKDFAILVRNNALTRLYEVNFNKIGLKYKVFGGFKFFERKEIQDVLAYLRVIANPKDSEALNRIINFPKRGIGDTTVKQLEQYASENHTSLFDVVSNIRNIPDFSNAVVAKISAFADLINGLKFESVNMKFSEFVIYLVQKIGLEMYYRVNNKEDDINRWANVEEFLLHVKENYNEDDATLDEFLHTVTLNNDVEGDLDPDFVTLSTMHAVKGLEFSVVFIVACEEGIIPSKMSMKESASEMDEERRVMYVAITRAKERLYISYVDGWRMKYNQRERAVPSRFVAEAQGERYELPTVKKDLFGREYYQDEGDSFIPKTCELRKVNYPYAKPTVQPSAPTVRNSDTSKFVTGAKVSHPKYGVGTVIVSDGSGISKTVTVAFKDLGMKKFAVVSAPLTLI